MTYTEGTPNTQFALITECCTYTVPGGYLNGTETRIDKGLQRVRYRGELINAQERIGIFRIWDILRNASEGSIVINTT